MARTSERHCRRSRLARFEACEAREFLSATYGLRVPPAPLAGFDDYGEVVSCSTPAHALTGLDQVRAVYGLTGVGQTVAVIDTGIAYNHDALGGGFGPGYRVVGGWDFANDRAEPIDEGYYGSHGTHVAGIIGSSDTTYPGVAPEVDLVGLRVYADDGGCYWDRIEEALWWVHANRFAFENPITAVNMSIVSPHNLVATPDWASMEDALAQLEADGIFVAVAAGNAFQEFLEPGLTYPAVSSHVVAVGSVKDDGSLSDFSQRLDRMIAAPGNWIMSTVPDYAGDGNGVDDDFAYSWGTSMASPYVAGASVLLRQAYTFATGGTLNQDQLYNVMYNTADTFYDSATQQYYRRLNLKAAVDSLMPDDDYGSSVATAQAMGTLTGSLSLAGHISQLDDVDWFQFTAGASGTVTVSASPTMDLVPEWQADGFNISVAADGKSFSFTAVAGQTYRFGLSTAYGIGNYTLAAQMTAIAAPSNLVDVQRGDFNGDGQTDIVGRCADDGYWWVALNHEGTDLAVQRWTRWSTNVTWTDVMVGDFNGDGRDDIVGRVAHNGDWWVAQSTGSGFTNTKWTRWSTNVTWTDVMVGDFNGDGRDDIVGRVAHNGDWWVAQSTGTNYANAKWTRWSTNVTWNHVMLGDFNGDGRDDIVGQVAQNGDWWVAQSTGTNYANTKWTRWSTNVTWNHVMLGDFNGDGRDDIVGQVAQNGDWWVAQSTGSNFANAKWTRWSTNVTWTDVMLGDFNGDGRDDIVGRVAHNGDWWVAQSTGSYFANAKWTRWSPNVTWVSVISVDYNTDGCSDIIGCVASNGDWWAARSNGSNGFVNQRLGNWDLLPAFDTTAMQTTSFGTSQPGSGVTLSQASLGPAANNATGLSTGQLGAAASLVASNDTAALDHGRGSVSASSANVLGRRRVGTAVSPADVAIERLDRILEVLRELDNPADDGPAEGRLRQSLLAARAGLLPEGDSSEEQPSWEALLGMHPFDVAVLDAYYGMLQ